MQHAVNDAKRRLIVGLMAVLTGIFGHHAGPEEELAVLKSDHVGRLGILKELPVYHADGLVAQDGNLDLLQRSERGIRREG